MYPKCPNKKCGQPTKPTSNSPWNKSRYICINYDVDGRGVYVCDFIEGTYYKGKWSKCLYESQPP